MGVVPVMWPYILVFTAFTLVLGGLVLVILRLTHVYENRDARQSAQIRSLSNAKLALESEAAAKLHQYLEVMAGRNTTDGVRPQHGGERDEGFEDDLVG